MAYIGLVMYYIFMFISLRYSILYKNKQMKRISSDLQKQKKKKKQLDKML